MLRVARAVLVCLVAFCILLLPLLIALFALFPADSASRYTDFPESVPDNASIALANFSFLSFASRSSVTWNEVLAAYLDAHRTVMQTHPADARYLLSIPAWKRVGLANNLEAMALSLFTAIVTDRAIIFRLPEQFSAVFQMTGIHEEIAAASAPPTLSFADLDYTELHYFLRTGRSVAAYRRLVGVLVDASPDACGYPYASFYANKRYTRLLRQLGDWRRPFSKFLFRFRPSVTAKVETWLAEHASPPRPLVALQLRFNGLWDPPVAFVESASECVAGLVEQSAALRGNATVLIISDKGGRTFGRLLYKRVQEVLAPRKVPVAISPAVPLHVADARSSDEELLEAYEWAAFDLALLARAALGVVTPASSFGYVGLYLGEGRLFMLDAMQVDVSQCVRGSSGFLANPADRKLIWFNPSYNNVAYCSLHDADFVRSAETLKSGSCDAEECPLCSCISRLKCSKRGGKRVCT